MGLKPSKDTATLGSSSTLGEWPDLFIWNLGLEKTKIRCHLWLLTMWKPNDLTKLIRLIVLLRLSFECWVLFELQCRPIHYVICRLSHCSIQYCKIIDVAKNLSVACIHFCIDWVALWKVTDGKNKQRATKNKQRLEVRQLFMVW